MPLWRAVNTVGRYDRVANVTPDLDLAALDQNRSVSRRHAEISYGRNQAVLRDTGSTNGTRVNGRRLEPREEDVTLSDGDVLTVGDVRLQYAASADWPQGLTPEWEVMEPDAWETVAMPGGAMTGPQAAPAAIPTDTVRVAPPVSGRVLATVVFTDIEDSTKRAAALGDRRWRELLDQHHEIMRSELEHSGGREVKTLGDGFLMTFDSPGVALHCISSMRERMRGIDLEIRAGVHTGECEVMGNDIGGIAVHIASRVSGKAVGGETLVSSTVKDLVAGSEMQFADRGVKTLKGVPGTWRLYSLISEG